MWERAARLGAGWRTLGRVRVVRRGKSWGRRICGGRERARGLVCGEGGKGACGALAIAWCFERITGG